MPRADAEMVWLLDLDLPGVTFRLSTQPIVLDDDGAPVEYAGGLSDVDFAEEIDLLTVRPASQTVALEAHITPTPVYLAARGIDLREAEAVLSYVLVTPPRIGAPLTGTYGARVFVARGRLAQPAWGDPQRPASWFAASLEATPWTSRVPLLSPQAVITAGDFPTVREDAAGYPFPLVIGQPGASLIGLFSTPAYPVATLGGPVSLLLVAGDSVTTTGDDVTISDGSASEAFPLKTSITDSGQAYHYVDITAAATISDTADVFAVAWSEASGAGGASRPGRPSTAGEAIRYLLARAGLPFDTGRSAPAIDALRGYRFDLYLNDPEVTAWEYLSTQVLPYLPVTLRAGPDGLILGYLDPNATAAQSAADGSPEAGWVRLDAVVYDDGPAPVRLTIQGGQNVLTGGSARTVILDSQADTVGSTAGTIGRRAGFTSRTREVPAETQAPEDQTLTLPWAQEERTLYALGLSWLALRAGRPYTVTYSAPLSVSHLSPGDAVAVTDPALGWTDRVLWVRSKRWQGGRWLLGLWSVERT
jgi:hypothetical protein